MGLFSKKVTEPVEHPAVERTVYVPAGEVAVRAHLAAYSTLVSPKHSDELAMQVSQTGDWTAIRLPDAVHPWQLHNLAFWMIDCPGADGSVIAESAAGPDHPSYRLVRDPEVPDALCGWDDGGNGWTVGVPGNDIVRPEPVPVPQAVSVPGGFQTWTAVTVRLQDPGHDMNPTNEPTTQSRKLLARSQDITW